MNVSRLIEILGLAFLALVGVALGYLGYIWVFTPEVQIESLGLVAPTIPSMSLLRSILGSGLLTFAAMSFLFIYDRSTWFRPLMLFATLLFAARCFSLIVDGVHDRMVLYAVLEGFIIIDVLFLNHVFKTGSN